MQDREHYAKLLAPLLGRAVGYARSIVRDQHAAEDAVQQAAVKGLERFGTFDATRPFKGWWFAIVRNCCIDALRLAKARKTESLDNHDVADTAHDDSEWQRLAAAMDNLSSDHQEILRLKYFADQSYAEIAETLAIPRGTVMSRLHLARKALAARISLEEP